MNDPFLRNDISYIFIDQSFKKEGYIGTNYVKLYGGIYH